MARTIKHPNSKAIYHAPRKVKPEFEQTLGTQYCDGCDQELFPEEEEVGLCQTCVDRNQEPGEMTLDEFLAWEDSIFGFSELEIDDDI